MHLVQPQGGEDFLLHRTGLGGVGERRVLHARRNALVDALVELDPEPWHRDEEGRSRPSQVLGEGLQAVVEEHPRAVAQGHRLHPFALGAMGQGQVGQHALGPNVRAPPTIEQGWAEDARHPAQGAEAVHHPFRVPGTAGGVDDGRQLVRIALGDFR
ncbi:hypothetical protein D9M68_557390 [compost metagenome]